MASVRECEKQRGAAEVKLNNEIRKLRKAVETAAPNPRTVANYMVSVDTAHNALIDAHVAYIMQQKADLADPRHSGYIDRLSDAVEAVREVAQVVIGDDVD